MANSVDIDSETSLSELSQVIHEPQPMILTHKSYLEFRSVRIFPNCLIFENPFEGKKYEERITIQNVGKKPVMVRIIGTTSSKIKIKGIRRGRFISPGLCIKRKVSYTVSMMTLIKFYTIQIYINEEIIHYKVLLKLQETMVCTDPEILDFGTIDAGPHTTKRKLKLINLCGRPVRYTVDLASNELGLMVKPNKGILMEYSTETLHIELSILSEGDYSSEFWIICENPVVIKVLVKTGIGRIEAIDQLCLHKFTFLHFHRTYFGLKSYKSLLLRNKSQTNSIFCVTGELARNKMMLHEAMTHEPSYKYFHVSPSSGKLRPNDVRLFLFTFEPSNIATSENENAYYVIMDINKIFCADLDTNKYDGVSTKLAQRHSSGDANANNLASVVSTSSITSDLTVSYEYFSEMEDTYENFADPPASIESFFEFTVRVLLYAEAETPSVLATPVELVLKDLKLNQTIHRVVQLYNESPHLPIIFRAKKALFVEVDPNQGYLKPSEKLDLKISITPKSYAELKQNLEFDLLYHDFPNINKELTVIGKVKVAMLIHEKIVAKKLKPDHASIGDYEFRKPNCRPSRKMCSEMAKEKAVLALPDARPCSLKPWKDEQICKTMYAGIPRQQEVHDDLYELSCSKQNLKIQNREFYANYIRSQSAKCKSRLFDLDMAPRRVKCLQAPPPPVTIVQGHEESFIPLTPDQLYKITVKPRNWIVDNVVCYSEFTNVVKITNKNDFAIRICLMSLKMESFLFPSGNRAVIKAHSQTSITFICSSGKSGIEYLTLDVIVNHNHVFQTAITIRIQPKSLKPSFTEATFHAHDPLYKYLELTNEYNSPIEFKWDFVGDLRVRPLCGCVQPKRSLTCIISYEIGTDVSNKYELVFRVENKRSQFINITIEKYDLRDVRCFDVLDFEYLCCGTSVSRDFLLANGTSEPLQFNVINCHDFENELTISPSSGILRQCGEAALRFNFQRTELGEFSYTLSISVAKRKILNVKITGAVVFPRVRCEPDVIKFRKIAASSFDVQPVKLINLDEVPVLIQFGLDCFTDLSLSDSIDDELVVNTENLTIDPLSERLFYFHLNPSHRVVTYFHPPLVTGTTNLKVYMSVHTRRLNIKSWKYDFEYFPHFNFKNITQHNIIISTKTPVKFCIRLDQLDPPFKLEHLQGGIVIYYPYSLTCQLESDQEVTFIASFEPENPGKYCIKLPVYIKDDDFESVHNFLIWRGIYHMPEMFNSFNPIFMGMIPLNFMTEKNIEFTLKYHAPNCNMQINHENENLSIECQNIRVTSLEHQFDVKILYSSRYTNLMETSVSFNCNCGGKFEFVVSCIGACENNIFTNYPGYIYYKLTNEAELGPIDDESAFRDSSCPPSSVATSVSIANLVVSKKHEVTSTFPFYPQEDTAFTKYMDEILSLTEMWLYEQGYFGEIYYTIPDTICLIKIECSKKADKYITAPKSCIDVPYHRLLSNIGGRAFNEKFPVIPYTEATDVILELYDFYEQILEFMSQLGVLLCQVKPYYFFPYNLYEKYVKDQNIEEAYTFEEFYLLSKRCWLDLILQTFKVVFLERLSVLPPSDSRNANSYPSASYCPVVMENVHTVETMYLLTWMNQQLQDQLDYLMDKVFGFCNEESRQYITNKYINNFDKDLLDGLGFIAITVSTCPYLAHHFKGIYIDPENENEYLHNSCLLINVWKLLHSSFTITPINLMKPNCMQMIMFLTYLHEFFFTLRTRECITLSAPLAETCDNFLSIQNDLKDSHLNYSVFFFGNEEEHFSTDKNKISIKPRGTAKINITYRAKFLRKVYTVMLLSGESSGSRPAHSIAYDLIGQPIIDKPNVRFVLKSPMFESEKFDLKCECPFKVEAEYEIFFSEKLPTTIEDFRITSYRKYMNSDVFSRVRFDSYIGKSYNNGRFYISGLVCSITPEERSIYVFARNLKLGDFSICITVEPEKFKLPIPIKVLLPEEYKRIKCTCDGGGRRCNRNIIVQVPCRNKLMWMGIMKHILQGVSSTERNFWRMHEDTNLSMNVLTCILQDHDHKQYASEDLKCVFKTTSKFLVKSDNRNIAVPDDIILNTFGSQVTTDLQIHMKKNLSQFNLELKSTDKSCNETRNYIVIVTYKHSRTDKSSM